MSRESFLSRVRQAAQAGQAYRVHLKPVPPEVGYVGAAGDLCDKMAAEVDAVGGRAFRVPDLLAARELLATLLEEASAKSALCWEHDLLTRLGLAEFLQSRSVVRHSYESLSRLDFPAQRSAMLACDIGISSVDCAIAETGTLMVCSRPGQERVASLLPIMHVAIVERQQIVPDLIDAFGILHERGLDKLPSNTTLITGPSKTGDIELQLTTGVHGPKHWRVILVG
ncbi:MAG: lactate utilization protein [Planctomycetales bacterium]|nr:lactate utilization protein [Planctomycetales bacterium]